MKDKSMTALICCFVKDYHNNYKYKIISDNYSGMLLSKDEKENIKKNMISGIKYFNPSFVGNQEDALRNIVDNNLSPSILGRTIFNEKSLLNAVRTGVKQYLIYASGYDTSIYKLNKEISNIKCFEIDKNDVIKDKINRLKRANIDNSNVNYISCNFTDKDWIKNISNSEYKSDCISFNSLLGITYYLTKNEFKSMINDISNIICDGSSILFDYPNYDTSLETKRNEELASEAGEDMKSKYTYDEIEKLLSDNNLFIYEHLNNDEMTNNYFYDYNTLNPNNKIIAPKGVSYLLAVKKL